MKYSFPFISKGNIAYIGAYSIREVTLFSWKVRLTRNGVFWIFTTFVKDLVYFPLNEDQVCF